MAQDPQCNTPTPSTEIPDLLPYNPPLEIINSGSTALIGRIKPGVVLKFPRYSWWHSPTASSHSFVRDIKHSFLVEEQILRILGDHPRIVRYVRHIPTLITLDRLSTDQRVTPSSFLGPSTNPHGLLLAEANNGNLQAYIDHHQLNESPPLSLQIKWRRQSAAAIHFIHSNNVIHADLRPDSFLLHTPSPSTSPDATPDLLLCDFGRSSCGDINGGYLPDSGSNLFTQPWGATKVGDISALGSIFYVIMTGHWPDQTPGPYMSDAGGGLLGVGLGLELDGHFPSVERVFAGGVIRGCWEERFQDMSEVIEEQEGAFADIAGVDKSG
ncbi:kinase-like domain-containing protein [Aspergillus karnatakaensis]|uniref:kinase-like domain-containing protein n=1 Tax=Aspergillus karnatakaensis TaxID=1810916 RepID=UPI003CCE2C60